MDIVAWPKPACQSHLDELTSVTSKRAPAVSAVVLATAVREKLDSDWPLEEAILEGSTSTMRAVLTTGAVAAFGFLPMALATVVISGILFSTALTLFLLPGVLRVALFVRERAEARAVVRPLQRSGLRAGLIDGEACVRGRCDARARPLAIFLVQILSRACIRS
jgi:hypothetical protein